MPSEGGGGRTQCGTKGRSVEVADNDSSTAMSTSEPRVGTKVEVKARFDGTWSQGFEVADVEDDGYRIKRMTDGTVLPSLFHTHEVRRERTRATWWI